MIILFQPLFILTYYGLIFCTQQRTNKVNRWARLNLNETFCNNLILLVAEPYIVLAIATFLHVRLISSGNTRQTSFFSNVFAIAMLAVVLVFPAGIYLLYSKVMKRSQPDYELERKLSEAEFCQAQSPSRLSKLRKSVYSKQKHKYFLEKYGSLVDGLHLKKRSGLEIRLLVLYRLLRQLVLGFTVIFLTDTPWIIIFVFNFMQLGMVSYLSSSSFYPDKATNRLEIFNELCVMGTVYVFISLSEFVMTAEARVWTGDVLVRLAATLMIVNWLYIAYTSVGLPIYSYCRLRYLKRKRLIEIRTKKE